MNQTLFSAQEWVMIDTETTGFSRPIYAVELGAQRMRGWVPCGEPFRMLINQNAEIPPQASRVHGYTREILERDGELPLAVYEKFRGYAADLPIVAYNLTYDLDDVLLPEWERLSISPIGSRGFCALRLAQRLLDPVPAGNCKLQTLRQFYKLEGGGAHTALGDVETVIRLLSEVLKPIAEVHGLNTWEKIIAYTEGDFFPSRLAFGKHKGRDYRDALSDKGFKSWLEWLTESTNENTRSMGLWYLARLSDAADTASQTTTMLRNKSGSDVTFGAEELERLVEQVRARLAQIETEYTQEKSNVSQVRSKIFLLVQDTYQRRDQLKLVVAYRERFLDSLVREGREQADAISEEFSAEKDSVDADYQDAADEAENTRVLSDEDALRMQQLWKKLVRLFHPDRYHDDPAKKETYEKLVATINAARDECDLELLELISKDPMAYIARQGWGGIDLQEALGFKELEKLYTTLQLEVIKIIELLGELRDSPDYELYKLSEVNRAVIEEVAQEQIETLDQEIEALQTKANTLKVEIEELDPAGIDDIS